MKYSEIWGIRGDSMRVNGLILGWRGILKWKMSGLMKSCAPFLFCLKYVFKKEKRKEIGGWKIWPNEYGKARLNLHTMSLAKQY